MEKAKQQIISYGSVNLLSAHCPHCDHDSFVVGGCYCCCNNEFEPFGPVAGLERVSTSARRRPVADSIKNKILEEQQYSCFYCGACFGFRYERKGKPIVLVPQFDHIMPVAYIANSNYDNVVAACQVCNQLKHAKMFESIQEIKDYLEEERKIQKCNF